MDELVTNRAFLQVAESGSFSAAALVLDVSVATVARQINSLEARLGVHLLHRSTRTMSLTEAGHIYCERIKVLLAQYDACKREISSYQTDVKGILRVHLRHSVGNQVIVPALPEFLALHPNIRLEVTLTDHKEDLVAQGVDVAVWLGSLEDSSLIARRLSPGRRMVCCSPAYAAQHGLPQTPQDLIRHNCIVYKARTYDNTWRFSRDGHMQSVLVAGNLESESAAVLMTCALSGLGIVTLQEAMVSAAIASGDLVNVFPDYQVSATDVDIALFAVYPGSKQTSPKARAFIDFLVQLFRKF